VGRYKKEIPSYLHCGSRDAARVVVHGYAPVYFSGKFNSPESTAAYRRWLAEYLATGRVIQGRIPQRTTVGELLLLFTKNVVEKRYLKNGQPTSEQRSFLTALRPVAQLYCDLALSEFQPRDLKRCRDALVAKGYTRRRINQHVGRIRRCFRWGVEEGLVPSATWHGLLAVEGLRFGEANREAVKVPPVPLESIEAIQPFVTPPIWAAIQVQLWTGCRPGEALSMRTSDITADDAVLPAAVRALCWAYRPRSHKAEHHGHGRIVLLGPHSRKIIEPWLRAAEPNLPLFSPAESKQWSIARRVARGKLHRRKLSRAAKPKRAPSSLYSVHAYGVAINRACKKAGIPPWHAHQIRHTAATQIAAAYGIEVARIVLGHRHIRTTELYAAADLIKAAEAIAAVG
jgi:integrase